MIFSLLLLLHLHPVPDQGKDRWLGSDKAKHFLVSAFIQSTSYAAFRAAGARNGPALAGASLVTLSFGVGKETHDKKAGGPFSPKDIAWDVLGAIAASALVSHTHR